MFDFINNQKMMIICTEFKEQLDQDLFERLVRFTGKHQQKKIASFHFRQDAERSLIADLLIRLIVRETLELRNEDIRFEMNEHGKPFLQGHDGFFFNISHAGEWVACAVAGNPVSIDVEKIKPVNLAIAERFFSPEEAAQLLEKPAEER